MTKIIIFTSLLALLSSANINESQATDIVTSSYTEFVYKNTSCNVQRITKEERRLNNFNIWYSRFLQDLSLFEAKYRTDFLDNTHLQKLLKDFGSTLMEGISPPSCKLHLANKVIDNLISKPLFFQVNELVPIIRKELEQLKPKLLALIEKGVPLEYNSNWDFFAMARPESYFNYIQMALEKSRFKEYKKVIKDWVIAVDTSISALIFEAENEKYKYKSKLIAFNLSKLFRVEHGLIDFSDFINPIIKELKARDSSMELSEIDALFSNQTLKASISIYAKLTDLYNAEMEKGSFEYSFDLLVIALPKMGRIKSAILRAKE